MHVIAAKAVAFGEALRPDFTAYQKAVIANAKALSESLVDQGLAIVTGGTDSHLILVDLRPKRVTGKAAEASLERAHMTANKNAIPYDPEKPAITSGHPPRLPRRHHPRLRHPRIPPDRHDDRQSPRWPCRFRRRQQHRDRSRDRRGSPNTMRALSDITGEGKSLRRLGPKAPDPC